MLRQLSLNISRSLDTSLRIVRRGHDNFFRSDLRYGGPRNTRNVQTAAASHDVKSSPVKMMIKNVDRFDGRQNGPFRQPSVCRELNARYTPENNYNVINNSTCRSRWAVFTGVQNDTRVYRP